jgi:hypothetical protein
VVELLHTARGCNLATCVHKCEDWYRTTHSAAAHQLSFDNKRKVRTAVIDINNKWRRKTLKTQQRRQTVRFVVGQEA